MESVNNVTIIVAGIVVLLSVLIIVCTIIICLKPKRKTLNAESELLEQYIQIQFKEENLQKVKEIHIWQEKVDIWYSKK